MTGPLLVEIIAYAPTAFYHCMHCEIAFREMGKSDLVHQEQLNSSLPPDLAQEYRQMSDWVKTIFQQHCDKVVMKVIDAASIEGVYKSIRYGVRHYPAVVVDHRLRFPAGDFINAGLAIRNILELHQSIAT